MKDNGGFNEYPKDMVEITEDSMWDGFFEYPLEKDYEYRQAYKDGNIHSLMETLKIFWVRKEWGIGYAIGRKEKVRFYKVGSQEAWGRLAAGFAAANAHDNS